MKLSFYDRQESLDTYYVKLRNINKLAQHMTIASFNAIAKTNNMKSKRVGKLRNIWLEARGQGIRKRLRQIKTHLAKLTRKDTKVKLTKDFKTKSGQIHIVIVDEYSNSIFSDNNVLKCFNSDGSSVKSNSKNHNINVLISHGKNVKCTKQNRQIDISNKPSSTKDLNKSKSNKIKQNNNLSLIHIILPDQKKDSQSTKQQAKKCKPILAQDSDEENMILDGPMKIDFI
ncbi:13256_t:CDS:2 [Funneliformis geosporum]|uniref:13256_t:CDS:1 n=1 Tax=Funneliformis geosporum TaxID=1117311 RepID=A0A9W4T063_9GLOM|nr:13256_t:CDS:2 [Funneliformis geosporum]